MAKRPTRKRDFQRDAPATKLSALAAMSGAKAPVALESDNRLLRGRVAELEMEVEQLRRDLASARAMSRGGAKRWDRQFVATELYHGDLASLYVASTRLQATLRPEELLAAIREIVINLIGVEEMAVFKNDPGTSTLSLLDCFGNAPGHYLNISLGDRRIRKVVTTGDYYLHEPAKAQGGPVEANAPVACVPLKVDRLVWGVIVIFRLLPHKERLVALDHQLMDLLSVQAGVALRGSELAAQRAREIPT